ncbi:MAG: MBL fold metallo-hydrolase [Novosphingobium sp.]
MIGKRGILTLLAFASLPSGASAASPAPPAARIVMLGTAGGAETRLRRVQSTTAVVVNGAVYLVDVGDGALRQLVSAGLRQEQVRAVFFTLFSQDRVGGFPNFIGTRWLMLKKTPLPMYGPTGLVQTLQGIDTSLKPVAASSFVTSKDPLEQIDAHEIVESGKVYRDENVTVTALALPRAAGKPPVAFAYRFETPGGSVVFTGATGARDTLAGFARGADVLVSEVFDIEGIVRKTGSTTPALRERVMGHMRTNHLDPEQIGTLAKAAGVGRVVLHHLEPGLDSETPEAADRGYAAGVRGAFAGPVILPRDLQVIPLAKPAR